jgi:hypothetical protein
VVDGCEGGVRWCLREFIIVENLAGANRVFWVGAWVEGPAVAWGVRDDIVPCGETVENVDVGVVEYEDEDEALLKECIILRVERRDNRPIDHR